MSESTATATNTTTNTIEKPIDQESTIPENPIQFISLISRSDKPLYIQAFNIDDIPATSNATNKNNNSQNNANANKFLKFNFLSHMALDIFISPSSLSLRQQQQQQQQTKGSGSSDINMILLFIQDQVMIYGYETNNGLKIIIGIDQNYQIVPENLQKLFLNVHKCYLKTIFNPLNGILHDSYPGSNDDEEVLLQSSTFDKNINRLVQSFI